MKMIWLIGSLVLVASHGWASLLGEQVTGSLQFYGAGPNYFNSNSGFVPAGCSNSGLGSTTVPISASVEFCYLDPSNQYVADITDTQLIFSDIAASTTVNTPVTLTFAFAPGLVKSVSEDSDSFPNSGVSYSFSNDLLTLVWNGGGVTPGTLQAVYNLSTAAPVPEPSMVLLMGAGLAGIGFRRRF